MPLICRPLPSYLSDSFSDLLNEPTGLLVMGRGLGLLQLISSFVRLYSSPEYLELIKEETSSEESSRGVTIKPLVFVLNLKEEEYRSMNMFLTNWGAAPNDLPVYVTNEFNEQKRSQLYRRGGVYVVTSRILIVDLLTNLIQAKDIEGFLVAHAETITNESTEAFILRIYKTQHLLANITDNHCTSNTTVKTSTKKGRDFIKAFSSEPSALTTGDFSKLTKVLKALYVTNLYLYPRFHQLISEELDNDDQAANIEEFHLKLSPSMKEVQNCIVGVVEVVIRNLKAATPLIDWTNTEIKVENFASSTFDITISRQLDHDWHKLKPSAKSLVYDLKELRRLFNALIHEDCVKFYYRLLNIKKANSARKYPSMWLLDPVADVLFRKAKERVYTFIKPSKKGGVGRIQAKLEQNPKWIFLRKLLSEIKFEAANHQPQQSSSQLAAKNKRVLIMVKDDINLEVVRTLLSNPGEIMLKRWLKYLEIVNEKTRSLGGDLTGIPEEARLLLEEEGRVRNKLFGRGSSLKRRRNKEVLSKKSSRQDQKKRQRIALEQSRGSKTLDDDDLEHRAALDSANAATKKMEEKNNDSDLDSEDEGEFLGVVKVNKVESISISIRCYDKDSDYNAQIILEEVRPSHIIIYDADASFIRAIEVYACCQKSTAATSTAAASRTEGLRSNEKVKVHFMLFKNSYEEKVFLSSLEREKNAFDRLIETKRTMTTPGTNIGTISQEIQLYGKNSAGTYANGALPLSVDTRTGLGKVKGGENKLIVVDVREFRSVLPSVLHQGGMRLVPLTLTVGDFILSPVHCVERKGISDLIQSFSSGRLYTQVETMNKYYKCPCVLIEFNPEKSFSLQNRSEIGGEIRSDSICSKLSLLTIHFPRVRLLWSRNPHETLKIFKSLKGNHEDPDVEKAVEIGSNEALDAVLDDVEESYRVGLSSLENNDENDVARKMLLRLPGINQNQAMKILTKCESFAELVNMSREDLKQLIGPQTGQKLFTFFRTPLSST